VSGLVKDFNLSRIVHSDAACPATSLVATIPVALSGFVTQNANDLEITTPDNSLVGNYVIDVVSTNSFGTTGSY